ncbi:hypothetical protein ACFQ8E_11390 [Isoptericola sp. NPDC056573]|uniref:hypothetical protein n=1 Tax=Isoptericola sp. NPDC056573 TaxID=3345868 RepID=UPI0036C39FE2
MTPRDRALPSDPERSRGLVLRWAGPTTTRPDVEHLAVDLVNLGDERWTPLGEERLVAAGILLSAGHEREGFGFALLGSQGIAVPLDPGDYARLPVSIGGSEWARAKPGPAHVRAVLPALSLWTEDPLSVDLSVDAIARHRPPDRPSTDGPSTDQQDEARRTLDVVSALLSARDRLARVMDEALTAASDDEAVARVAALLGCEDASARTVLHAGLLRFRSRERLEDAVTTLREELAAPPS